MSKWFRVLAVLYFCQTVLTVPVFASTSCTAQFLNDREVVVRIGMRVVTLIGWEHLNDASSETLVRGLQTSFEAAKAGKCGQALHSARATLDHLNADLSNATIVFDRIFQAHKDTPLSFVGLEMTPDQLEKQWKLNFRIDQIFSELENLCGPDLQTSAAQLRLMIPGPEFEFYRLNPGIPVKALEDQTLKDANAKDFDGAEQDTFDYSNPAITAESKAAIEILRQNLMDQAQPSESTIQQALSFEKDPVQRAKLEAELRFSIKRGMRIISGAYRRNVAIATGILEQHGNAAIPIGFRHVNHLVGEILRQCESL